MPRIFTAGMGPDLIEGGIHAAGYHPAALAYRAKLVAAGVTPTPAQMAALTTFFGKTWGLAGKMVQSLVPVWGSAAANAVSLFPSAFQSVYSGAFDFAGKKSLSTGGYLTNTPSLIPSAVLSSNSCGQLYYAISTASGPYCDMGSRTGAGPPIATDDFSLFQFSGTIYASAGTGVKIALTGGVAAGVIAHNSTPSGQKVLSIPVSTNTLVELASAAAASGPCGSVDFIAHGLDVAGSGPQFIAVTRSYAAWAVWKNFSHSDASVFAQALYTLTNALRA